MCILLYTVQVIYILATL